MAADFLARAGPGINIMASNIRYQQLQDGDWDGLASRVGHVRLCGDVAAALTNFSTCPATRWQPRSSSPITEAHARLAADPAFTLYRDAALAAVSRGLHVVLDPFHVGFGLVVDVDLLTALWGALMVEFDEATFPPAVVAFEMANEPGNAWGRHRVRGSLRSVYRHWIAQVHAEQPSRVLILPGELGFRCDGQGGGHSVSSSNALAADAEVLARLAAETPLLAATFHYYEPRCAGTALDSQPKQDPLPACCSRVRVPHRRSQFTAQQDGAGVRWRAAAQAAAVAADMAALREAVGDATPLYMGEFGLAVHAIARERDAAAWLRAVREAAEGVGSGWALWTYFTSRQGLVDGGPAAGVERATASQWPRCN